MLTAFDLKIKHFGSKYFIDSDFEYSENFYHKGELINMEILSFGLLVNYVFNNKNHYLGSVYALNSFQLRSSGSFLIGGDLMFSRMKSNDYEINENSLIISGPNIGYSYIYVFRQNWFSNIMLNISPDIGINYFNGDFCFAPQARMKTALGYHGKSWSMNIVLQSNLTFYIWGFRKTSALETNDIGFTLSKRF
jgi:hypothetical protein